MNRAFLLTVCTASVLWAAMPVYTQASDHEPIRILSFEAPENYSYTYPYEEKPTWDEVNNLLPDSVTAWIETDNGCGRLQKELPVSWTCEYDYASTDELYYIYYADLDANRYTFSDTYDQEDYYPFIEIILEKPEGASLYSDALSSGQINIAARAHQQVEITWTCLKTIDAYVNSSGNLTGTFEKGTVYQGIPYGQPVTTGKYVPFAADLETFINAAASESSLFYTSRASYGSKTAPYYSSDCSCFVSYCYGLSRMTTSTIASSALFSAVSDNSLDNAEVGDCFNRGGYHVEIITGITRDSNGSITSIEVCEQTPPKAQCINYTQEKLQRLIDNNGYKLLRYSKRDSVEKPASYTGYLMSASGGFTGFIQSGDLWYYYVNGKPSTYSGLVKGTIEGYKRWYYVQKGIVNFTATGFSHNENGWYYLKKGRVSTATTGLIKGRINGVEKWYYVNKGKVNFTYTGFGQSSHGWYYLKDGSIISGTGLLKGTINEKYAWYYVKAGKADLTYTGFGKNIHGWYYMENGTLSSKTALIKGTVYNTYTWWKVVKGKVSFTTGVASNARGTFYVTDGSVNYEFTGTYKDPDTGITYKVVNGAATPV